MEHVLECRGLTKIYESFPVVNALNLTLPKGQIVGLLGPNGSGKTTLIKLAAGLLTPTAGQILIHGSEPGPKTKAIVSYLPERPYFSGGMQVFELLDYFSDFYADFDRVKAEEMLRHLGIDAKARLKTLSKGNKEKVQLVLVMSRNASLYLLDEPIGGVDPATRDYILQTILTNYNSESTILISTHLIFDIEKILDGFLFFAGGQVILQGSADATRAQYGKSLDELFREVFRC